MSACPQKDIHSVYIDGELPEKFRAEYEAHIAGCAACQAELATLRNLRALLTGEATAEAAAPATDTVFLEQSFARLQTKLRYSRTVGAAQGAKGRVLSFTAAKWAVSAAAAAAVFALVLTPLRTKAGDGASGEAGAVTAIASAELEPLTEKGVVIDGNISHTELSSLAVADSPHPPVSGESGDALPLAPVARPGMEQRTVSARTVSSGIRRSLRSVDVFRPTNINTPQGVSRMIPIDGNISHEAISPLAVTSNAQDAAR